MGNVPSVPGSYSRTKIVIETERQGRLWTNRDRYNVAFATFDEDNHWEIRPEAGS